MNDGVEVLHLAAMVGVQHTMGLGHFLEPLFTLRGIAQFKNELGLPLVGGVFHFFGELLKLEGSISVSKRRELKVFWDATH